MSPPAPEKFIEYLEYMRANPYLHGGTMHAFSGALGLAAEDAPMSVMMKVYAWSRGSGWRQECHLMVACLFAAHPLSWQYPEDEKAVAWASDMGASLARLRQGHANPQWIDDSVELLLIAEREVIYDPLIDIFSQLRAAEVPVDFSQLLGDLLAWRPEGKVARRWARAYVTNETEEGVVDAEVR
jgi:CRISPR type I-E-associated protein CasB/Cse2